MKTIVLAFVFLLVTSILYSKPITNLKGDKAQVYEGTITGIKMFYGLSDQGLNSTGIYYLSLNT